jgi:uncharacterized membrane protein YidH (DUF202 family)
MRKTQNIKISLLGASAALVLIAAALVLIPPAANAAGINPGGLPDVKANTDTIQKVLGIIFGIIGAFAFLNIVFSGFKYVTSAGDPQKTSEAKNGIVYSVVGLIIAIVAEAFIVFIVRWVGTP